MSAGDISVRQSAFRDGSRQVTIGAGIRTVERVVPPAGPEYAFDRVDHPLRVVVSTSPTGRSTRMWINGVEIDWRVIQ